MLAYLHQMIARIILSALLILFLLPTPAHAAPKFVTSEEVQSLITQALSPIQTAINSLSNQLSGLLNQQNQTAAKVAELEERLSQLEQQEATPSSSFYVVSDSTWRFNTSSAIGWLTSSFNDSAWTLASAPSGGQCSVASIGLLINQHGALPMSVASPNWTSGTGYFRKTFYLNSIPSSSTVRVVLDDDGDLYLNGNLVLTDHDNAIAGTQQVIVPTSYFISGVNTLGLVVNDSLGGCQHAHLEMSVNL
jgi:hypothetical protein